ncbi:hypothetical protein KY285_010837 [Solanum tuberosum]|nr:hypothetical protein KY289_011409 [Solanum tuberosum]KAH0735130.1 hypothetical protein KY285_010837 [Solanum tuberosum]
MYKFYTITNNPIWSDRPGLLSEVRTVLTNLKCNVVNAKVWTHNAPVAAIVQVTGEETRDQDYERAAGDELDEKERPNDYFVVTIRCKDRPKLLVDTIFTLADIQYLVFHGNADAEGPVVHQSLALDVLMVPQ